MKKILLVIVFSLVSFSYCAAQNYAATLATLFSKNESFVNVKSYEQQFDKDLGLFKNQNVMRTPSFYTYELCVTAVNKMMNGFSDVEMISGWTTEKNSLYAEYQIETSGLILMVIPVYNKNTGEPIGCAFSITEILNMYRSERKH